MDSIKDRVAIVGMGCTKFGERWDASFKDLAIEAAYEACEDAGIEPKDIQAAWFGTVYTNGARGLVLCEPLKLYNIPITGVENMCATGTEAIRGACYAVAAGIYDIVLAIGIEKSKDGGYSGLDNATNAVSTGIDPEQSPPGLFALMATAYFNKYGLSPEEGKRMIGMISEKSHNNGALNPKAHFQKQVPLEKIVKAPIIAWPLGLFDCCGVSDGAAAAIICRADMAKNFKSDPIYIKAIQVNVGLKNNFDSNYDYTHMEEAYVAAQRAYAEAGIKNPRKEIGMAEVHDCFSITEAVLMEDLGFSERGKVKDDIEAGVFNLDGELPVQPDGGLKCFGHPVGASGIRMVYECYQQLLGRAGDRQIKNVDLALTHNLAGSPRGALQGISIWGRK